MMGWGGLNSLGWYGELITLPLIGGVEWAEETGGVGEGEADNSISILLGFKPMVTDYTRGTTTGCVSPEVTIDEE